MGVKPARAALLRRGGECSTRGMGSSARSVVFACALLVPSMAFAQGTAPPTATPTPPPPGGGSPTATGAAGGTNGATEEKEKKPVRDAAGYAYDDKKPARRAPTGRVI